MSEQCQLKLQIAIQFAPARHHSFPIHFVTIDLHSWIIIVLQVKVYRQRANQFRLLGYELHPKVHNVLVHAADRFPLINLSLACYIGYHQFHSCNYP